MKIAIVTLFPEMFTSVTDYGVTRKAFIDKKLEFSCVNPRDYATDRHGTIDARPYGGGPGMVMMAEPLSCAVAEAKQWCSGTESLPRKTKVIYFSPQGKTLNQGAVKDLGQFNLILVAGRYEGVDERFIENEVDEEWSIGDYVLSGGELPAMVLIDAIARLVPGVLGHDESATQDSFEFGLLDCPHYTRPEQYADSKVPSVLLSGNHKDIARWRFEQSLMRTQKRRPELFEQFEASKEKKALLDAYQKGLKKR